MAREYGRIGDVQISKARAMAKAGRTPDGKIFVFQDDSISGFQLRVQGKSAAWIVRTPQTTVTIGYVWPENDSKRPCITTISKVRDLADAVWLLLADNKKEWLKQLISTYHRSAAASSEKNDKRLIRTVMSEIEAAIAAPTPPADDTGAWTFRDCVEEAIKLKTAPDAKKAIRIKPSGEKDIRTTFARSYFQEVLDKSVVKVTSKDIQAVRDQVYRSAGASPANKVVIYTRSILSFCWRYLPESGLQSTDRWWEILETAYEVQPRDRQPTIEEVVKTMILAEEYLTKPLPGRAFATNGVRPGSLAALWWIVLTCQRVEAGLSLLPENVVEDQERPGQGWLLAAWDAADMKGGKSFVLPIPQKAWSFIDGFRKQSNHHKSTSWAFPSEVKPEVHISGSGTYRIVYRLAARDKLLQEESNKKKKVVERDGGTHRKWTPPARTKRRDLLKENDIEWWSHHDLRNTLTTFMTGHRMPGGASAILAHEVEDDSRLRTSDAAKKKLDFQKERAARITQIAYGAESQFIELKSLAMQKWTDAILDEYDRQKAEKLIELGEAA